MTTHMNSPLPITAHVFFAEWKRVCAAHFNTLIPIWSDRRAFTHWMLNGPESITGLIASKMGLRKYSGYFFVDNVIYAEEDLIPGSPDGSVWLRRIRIALEHENYFSSGLYTELSHLLTTACDLRVLIAYPPSEAELVRELKYLHSIVVETSRSPEIAATKGLLCIAGWPPTKDGVIEWWGYVYEQEDWRRFT